MSDYLKELNLIDLVSEKHKKLRRRVMKLWFEKKGEEISDTEAHMMGMVHKESMIVAEIARKMDLSRQAAHKCAKKLIDRGYLQMVDMEGNHRDKLLVLTEKGKEYCEEMIKLKEDIEGEISQMIGKDKVELLKKYLRKDWIRD